MLLAQLYYDYACIGTPLITLKRDTVPQISFSHYSHDDILVFLTVF